MSMYQSYTGSLARKRPEQFQRSSKTGFQLQGRCLITSRQWFRFQVTHRAAYRGVLLSPGCCLMGNRLRPQPSLSAHNSFIYSLLLKYFSFFYFQEFCIQLIQWEKCNFDGRLKGNLCFNTIPRRDLLMSYFLTDSLPQQWHFIVVVSMPYRLTRVITTAGKNGTNS